MMTQINLLELTFINAGGDPEPAFRSRYFWPNHKQSSN